jgi:hypothetical protein
MNLRLAKKLRKIAKSFVEFSKDPENFMTTQYAENKINRKIFTEYVRDTDDKIIFDDHGYPTIKQKHILSDGTVSVIKDCFRGQYLAMKKNIVHGRFQPNI